MYKTQSLRILWATILVGLLVSQSASQTETLVSERASFSGSIGIGMGTLSTSGGFCGRGALAIQHGANVFSGRVFRITQFIGFGVEPRSHVPEESETEFALMYGRDISGAHDYFVVSLGLGYVLSRHRGRILPESPSGLVHELVTIGSLGAAIDVLVTFPLGESVALGLSFVGNINTTRSFGGGLITFAFGTFE